MSTGYCMADWRAISPMQIRAARGLMNWTMNDLACAADVSLSSIRRLESTSDERASIQMSTKVLKTFEAQGVVFVADGRGYGVILMKKANSLRSRFKTHELLKPRS